MDPVSAILSAIGLTASIGGTIFGAQAQTKQAFRSAQAQYWQAGQEASAAFTGAEQTGQAAVTQAGEAEQAGDLQSQLEAKNADLTEAQGNLDENRVRNQTTRTLATQRAFYAGGNIDAQSGSPLTLMMASAAQGAADARIVRANALTQRAGQEWQSYGSALGADDTLTAAKLTTDDAFQSAQIKARGAVGGAALGANNAFDAGDAGAASTLLNGVTQWAGLANSASGQSALKWAGNGISSLFNSFGAGAPLNIVPGG